MTLPEDDLLATVERYLADHSEITPTAFGVLANGDPRLVFDLRNGRECRRATRERVVHFITTGIPYSRRNAAA